MARAAACASPTARPYSERAVEGTSGRHGNLYCGCLDPDFILDDLIAGTFRTSQDTPG